MYITTYKVSCTPIKCEEEVLVRLAQRERGRVWEDFEVDWHNPRGKLAEVSRDFPGVLLHAHVRTRVLGNGSEYVIYAKNGQSQVVLKPKWVPPGPDAKNWT